MLEMKVAIIGCGMIVSTQHIKAYARNNLTEIKYLVDIKHERALELSKIYDVPFTETGRKGVTE